MNKTINELTALTDAVSSDELIIYDVSTGESKKITKQNLLKELQTEVNGKQNTLTFDSTPTTGSSNPATSGGIFSTLAELGTVITKSDTVTIPAMDNFILASVVTVPKGKWIAIGQTEYTFDDANAYLFLTMRLTNQVEDVNFKEIGMAYSGGGLNGTGYVVSDGTTTVQLAGYAYGNYSGSQTFTLTLIKIGY